ncbi:MAG: hypothetical protein L0Z62_22640 [Gemmataceae bacterium]|nr:hypothetical protein [Gemmataceae bacterium]
MSRFRPLARRVVLAGLALFALGAVLATPTQARADSPFRANCQIIKQRVNSTTYKAKLRITCEVTGVAKNTFETGWVYLPRYNPRPLPPMDIAIFRLSGSLRWTGSAIVARVELEAGLFGYTARKSLTVSVAAQ